MAGRKSRIAQLASLGEDVLDLAAKSPAGARVRRGAVQLKDRVDDLQKQVRGLQQLEDSLAKLDSFSLPQLVDLATAGERRKVRAITLSLADVMASDNPRFNRGRFYVAAGLTLKGAL